MYISALEEVYTLCVDEAAQQAQLSWSVCGDWSAPYDGKNFLNFFWALDHFFRTL